MISDLLVEKLNSRAKLCSHSFQDDIGLGSVVGSAVFNIMLVISVCALFAGAVSVSLHFWSVLPKRPEDPC